MNAELKEGIRK